LPRSSRSPSRAPPPRPWPTRPATTCEIHRDGHANETASGPCTFSQRQGYIDLDLKNGNTYSLSPGEKPNHFTDQKGRPLVRTDAGGNRQVFEWKDGRRVVVTFTD